MKDAGARNMLKLLYGANVMNVLDSASTFFILKTFPAEIAYEQNPIIRYSFAKIGYAILIIKIFLMLLVSIWFYNEFKERHPTYTMRALSFVLVFFSLCVISNIASIIYI